MAQSLLNQRPGHFEGERRLSPPSTAREVYDDRNSAAGTAGPSVPPDRRSVSGLQARQKAWPTTGGGVKNQEGVCQALWTASWGVPL
ncbi:MAG: hypothetical protein ACRD5H_07900 [Nitrososphaerales archaeon]